MDIIVQVIDGRVDIAKYIHLHPRLLLYKNSEEQKYKARDDMYSVGIIMWELWSGKTPSVPTEAQNVNNGMLSVDSREDQQSFLRTEIGEYLSKLKKPHSLRFSNQLDNSKKMWWELISDCLGTQQIVRAGDWLSRWNGLTD